ncbi:DEAD/DEAH box helicase [Sphingobacterium suaedae]|uniref:DEAD/DEAH box helicase n=1 Tax=Sphingobacterium suaedae TaxID=1686402 RepID=A0ABW5KKT8_9SPHI
MDFKDIGIMAPILSAILEKGYAVPTEVQKQAIPSILQGKDVIGCAQTGTGKTGAFAIPLLQLLAAKPTTKKMPRALILAPTRELAVQIGQNITAYSKNIPINELIIYGGVSQQSQIAALRRGIDIIVATPGRLMDLLTQGHLSLAAIGYLVLDEADNMLDMGFINDIRKIIKMLPNERQTLLFSATMPMSIRKLAIEILISPMEINVSPVSSTALKIIQSVFFIEKKQKVALLTKVLRKDRKTQTLIFMRTKHGADRLAKTLGKNGLQTACIHGNKSQSARQNALMSFKSGKISVLIATDIAARGIDIKELPQVINYDLPEDSETYVHRIGRTGRAGNTGKAISFCSREEKPLLLKIQKLIGFQMPIAQ